MPTVLQQHHNAITMTTVDIPEKQHRKLKKEALKRNIDLKDLIAEKLSSIVIVSILLVSGLGIAFAADDNVPFDFWNAHVCTFMGFPLENGTTIYKYECIWTGWEHMVKSEWQIKQPSDISIIPLPDAPEAFLIWAPEDRQEIVVEEPVKDQMDLDFEAFFEPEPLTREEREIESAILKLAKCRTGIGAYAAYQEQEEIEGYTDQTRWEFQIRDNLSQSPIIGKMLKAIEECRIMQTYLDMNLIGAFELNRYLADVAGVDYLGRPSNPEVRATDQSDASVLTDPVTEKDKADELKEMEELRDRLIEERVFEDPDAEFTGINRGFQPEGIRCQVFGQPAPVGIWADEVCPLSLYEQHILKNWDNITYSDILTLQCDNFLYIYQHKIGTDEFPKWLNHCVPKVVRN